MLDPTDPLLSAYLDDELTADERRSADAAIAADPEKAEELRSLAAARDLIAGLPRPAPVDLAPEVLRRIAAASARPRSTLDRARRPALWAAAAGVLLAVSLTGLRLHVGAPDQNQAPPPASVVAVAAFPTPEADAPSDADAAPVGPPLLASAIGEGALIGPPGPEPKAEPAPLVAARDAVALELVGRSGPHRAFIAPGPLDPAQVGFLMGNSSHRGFYRFDLPGADDEASPGDGSVVFAAEMGPSELATLRRRLDATFPGQLDEVEAAPPLLGQLAEIGRASSHRSEPIADVLFPQTKMALKTPAEAPAPPTPSPEEASPPDAGGAPAPGASSTVVLIWIVAPSTD